MCQECVGEVETKVCKVCGEEKPVGEFGSKGNGNRDAQCRVCLWFSKRNIDYDGTDWCIEYDTIIMDYLLNKKGSLNDISIILNKSLYDICFRVVKVLKISGQTKLPLVLKCESCGKDYDARPSTMINSEHNFCTKECHHEWLKHNVVPKKIIGKGECINCHKEFNIISNVPDQKFCCTECKNEYNYRENPKYENKICVNCNKEYTRRQQSGRDYQNNFCCLECELDYKHKEKWEFRKCEICNEEFECKKSSTKRFCSPQCQSKWQSEYLIGENAVGYNHGVSKEERTLTCEWCNTSFEVKPYEIDTVRFCSKECRQDWFAKEYSQTEEFREQSAIRAAKMLEDDVFNQRVTGIQITINSILDKLKINNKPEKAFGKVTVDNYLIDSGLMIENMGTFYHCDYRKYPLITYERQVTRIRMDKIKHSYLKNNHNIEVLYLWEEEINNNPKLCETLIKLYVDNNGELKNYHSFNYKLNKIGEIELNDIVEQPYMEWGIEELHKVIDISTKEKMSHKQPDKWISFNCDYCGTETEQLKSHYKGAEHHYCSAKCMGMANRNRAIVSCNNCNKEIEVTLHKYNTNKRFFCDQNCQHEYQRRIGFKKDDTDLKTNKKEGI